AGRDPGAHAAPPARPPGGGGADRDAARGAGAPDGVGAGARRARGRRHQRGLRRGRARAAPRARPPGRPVRAEPGGDPGPAAGPRRRRRAGRPRPSLSPRRAEARAGGARPGLAGSSRGTPAARPRRRRRGPDRRRRRLRRRARGGARARARRPRAPRPRDRDRVPRPRRSRAGRARASEPGGGSGDQAVSEGHLQLRGIRKAFGAVPALRDCDLEVVKGEVMTLLGPSGCGKTTLLRTVAGFVVPDAGSVSIGGREMTLTPPNRRSVGMVFQHYALFPHMTVFGNVAYGLRVRRRRRPEIERRVREALELVELAALIERWPAQL